LLRSTAIHDARRERVSAPIRVGLKAMSGWLPEGQPPNRSWSVSLARGFR
jgi:hypothetical protein